MPLGLGLEYMCHIQGHGDTEFLKTGEFCGTRGQSRRLEGFAARLAGPQASSYAVIYSCHVQGVGDIEELSGPSFCGTRGQSRRLEALKIRVERIK